MKHEMRSAFSPVGPVIAPRSGTEANGSGSLGWPSVISGPNEASQPQRTEKGNLDGLNALRDYDPLLTVNEFANQLKVSRACVRKWILDRRIAVVRLGRLVRLRTSELRRLIDEGTRPRGHR